jgi:hypothetical protein
MPCEAAIDLATNAVAADVNGEAARAVDLYLAAADALETAAKSAAPGEAGEMRAKAAEYRARVGVLKSTAQKDQMAAVANGRAAARLLDEAQCLVQGVGRSGFRVHG